MVDLPGFRDFAVDPSKQHLSQKIDELVLSFMRDKRNVMLCVEQAADAATMSTLQKCRQSTQSLNALSFCAINLTSTITILHAIT